MGLAISETLIWVGGSFENSWHASANWTGGVLPQPGDKVVVLSEGAVLKVTESVTVDAVSLAPGVALVSIGPAGSLHVTGAAELAGATLRSESGGSIRMVGAQAFEAGLLAIRGPGSIDLPLLRTMDHTSIELSEGAMWSTPIGVTNFLFEPYRGTARGGPMQVRGVGTRLDARSLLSVTLVPGGGGGKNEGANLLATEGAELDLSGLRRLSVQSDNVAKATVAFDARSVVNMDALEFIGGVGEGPGLHFDLPAVPFHLPRLDEIGMLTTFRLASGTVLACPRWLRADHCVLLVPAGSGVEAPLLADFRFGSVDLEGTGYFRAPNLRNLDGSRFSAVDGATLDLPQRVESYLWNGSETRVTYGPDQPLFRAAGAGSRISLRGLRTIIANNSVHLLHPSVRALDGGRIELPSLLRVTANLGAYFSDKGTFEFRTVGGGEIEMPRLAEILGSGPCGHVNCSVRGVVFDLQSPRVELLQLEDVRIPTEFLLPTNGVFRVSTTELTDARFWLPDGATFQAPFLTRLRGGSLSLSGSALFAAENLADLSGTHVSVNNGARFVVPAGLTEWDTSTPVSEWYPEPRWLFAEGPDSRIDGKSLRTLRGGGIIEAANGGTVDLANVVGIESVAGPAPLDIVTPGAEAVRLDALREITNSGGGTGTRLRVEGDLRLPSLQVMRFGSLGTAQGKTLQLPQLIELERVAVTLRYDSRIDAPRWSTATDCQLDMDRFTTAVVGTLHWVNGRLTGAGRIEGNLVNQGVVQPGNPFGDPYTTLTISGNFEQLPHEMRPGGRAGSIVFVVGGRTATGILTIDGRAHLGGMASVELRDNYDPRAGTTFEVGRWASVEGGFWNVTGASYGVGKEFHFDYGPGVLRLVAASAAPPGVIAITPAAPVAPPLTSVDVAFSEVMNPASMVESAVALTTPDGSSLAIERFQQIGQAIWRISFAPQTAVGRYRLALLPSLQDAAGIFMPAAYEQMISVASSTVVIRPIKGSWEVEFSGTLESATNVNGPWAEVSGALSPFSIVNDGPARFFRARP